MNFNDTKEEIIGKPRRFLKKTFDRFIRIRGTPREIALGFAMGIFISLTPTMGIQIWTALFLAALFKLNKIAAVAGVWITNPLTAPALYGMTYLTGAKILGFEKIQPFSLELSLSNLQTLIAKAPTVFGAMIVGGIAIGIPLAVLAYYLSFYLVRSYQPKVKARIARRKARRAESKAKAKTPSRKKRQKKKKSLSADAFGD